MSPRAPSRNPLKPKARMAIPRQEMPQADPAERAHTYEEVNLGFELEAAKQEAQRCLECASPKCVDGCPVGVSIREFVDLVLAEDYLGAAAKIREANVLPAITGQGYEDLTIAKGDEASRAYLSITFGDVPPEEAAQIRKDLLSYCGLDTEGMVRIVARLRELAA